MYTDIMYRDTMTITRCSVCDERFTRQEWDNRHSDEEGQDCHERCCPICNAETEDTDTQMEDA